MSALEFDHVWPRDEQHRYRVYSVNGNRMEVLAAAPDPEGFGLALATIHADERAAGTEGLRDLGMIGVLDVLDGGPDAPGNWIIVPFTRKAP